MVTKPKDVPWGDLNDLRGDLFEWLVAQKLASVEDSPLKAVLKLRSSAPPPEGLTAAVADALMELELFIAAGDRADGKALSKMKQGGLSEDDAKLMVDDSLEREADRAIRGLLPTIHHIELLNEKIANTRAARARVQRLAAADQRVEALEARMLLRITQLETLARSLHRLFRKLNPSVSRDTLTLSGYQRLEKRLRLKLEAAGFPGTELSRRA